MQVNNDDEQPKQADNLSRIYRFFCGKKFERIALFCLLAAASLDSRDFIK